MARSEHIELAQRIQALDEVVPAPPRAGSNRHLAMLAVTRSLRQAKLDAAVLLAPSFEAALTVWLAGIPVRVGHATDHRSALLNRVVGVRECHRSDGFRDVVSAFGATSTDDTDCQEGLRVAASDHAYVDRMAATLGLTGHARLCSSIPRRVRSRGPGRQTVSASLRNGWRNVTQRCLSSFTITIRLIVPTRGHRRTRFERCRGRVWLSWPV